MKGWWPRAHEKYWWQCGGRPTWGGGWWLWGGGDSHASVDLACVRVWLFICVFVLTSVWVTELLRVCERERGQRSKALKVFIITAVPQRGERERSRAVSHGVWLHVCVCASPHIFVRLSLSLSRPLSLLLTRQGLGVWGMAGLYQRGVNLSRLRADTSRLAGGLCAVLEARASCLQAIGMCGQCATTVVSLCYELYFSYYYH